jgi:cytochrome c556
MKRFTIVTGACAVLAAPALAADDAVAVRKALMSSVGAAAAVAGGVLKGEVPYAPVVGKATIAAIYATSQAYPDFFPAGTDSASDDRSAASIKIWEDAAGFAAQIEKFQAAVAAANEAAGRDGPADQAAFGAAMGPVFDTCQSCHEGFRVQR